MALLLNWRVWVAIIVAGLLAFSHLTVYRAGRHAIQDKWDAANVKQEAKAQEQAERNRELQRAAERNYVVQQQAQDHYFVTTVKEIEHAAAPLASCALPPDLVRLLNDANDCAASDTGSACGAAGRLPAP